MGLSIDCHFLSEVQLLYLNLHIEVLSFGWDIPLWAMKVSGCKQSHIHSHCIRGEVGCVAPLKTVFTPEKNSSLILYAVEWNPETIWTRKVMENLHYSSSRDRTRVVQPLSSAFAAWCSIIWGFRARQHERPLAPPVMNGFWWLSL